MKGNTCLYALPCFLSLTFGHRMLAISRIQLLSCFFRRVEACDLERLWSKVDLRSGSRGKQCWSCYASVAVFGEINIQGHVRRSISFLSTLQEKVSVIWYDTKWTWREVWIIWSALIEDLDIDPVSMDSYEQSAWIRIRSGLVMRH